MSAPPVPLDRTAPPEAGRSRPFRFPPLDTGELSEGLRLLMAPRPGCGLVQVELICPAGAEHEAPGEAGLATLTASLLDEGTARWSALEIAGRIEGLGGSMSTSADWDAAYLSVSLLADHLAAGLRLLSELARSASFPPDEVERLRRQRLAELQRRSVQPGFSAAVALARAVYGETPYGHSLLGQPATVSGLGRDRIVDFASRHVTPASAALVAAGDFDPALLAKLCGEAFGGWRAQPSAPPPALAAPPAGERKILIVDRPGAPQTELRLGHAGVSRSHPDYAPLTLLNSLLGGKFTSRLNLSLRERHGITYGASSRFSGRRGPGPFVAGAAVDNASVGLAVSEILAELRRLQDELVDTDELADSCSYLLGVFPYTLQTVGGLCQRIQVLAVHDLPHDHYTTYQEQIAAVDAAEIRRLARAHFKPDHTVIVAVGPAAELSAQLAPMGAVEVVEETAGRPPGRASSHTTNLMDSTV